MGLLCSKEGENLRIIGIDPGYAIVGYGTVEYINNKFYPVEFGAVTTQAHTPFEDRLKECELELITSVPEQETMIMADGRRMWRIFDNLLNNICKYTLAGTRVYLDLQRQDDKAIFVFKNTSRERLNISEEELMERFTRGDKSRSSEGNGLGLSIAKSIAELQNGRLSIEIDGDLFKAVLEFPLL